MSATISGVDVSSHQPDWHPRAADDFVFIKATEGRTYTNPELKTQERRARDADLVVGFYHWLCPGHPQAQAAHFVARADPRPGDLLACDWEEEGTSETDKDRFLAAVKRLRPECHVGLYCSRSWWNGSNKKGGNFLWVAEYGVEAPAVTEPYAFWQYTKVPLDTDRASFPTRKALRAWATGAGPNRPRPDRGLALPTPQRKVPFRNGWTCTCVATSLPLVERRMLELGLIRHCIDVFQFGWRTDVQASADTHACGGNTDVGQFGEDQLRVWRESGWNMQHRTVAQGFDLDHGHGAPIGCPHLSDAGRYQMSEYLAGHGRPGRNGLRSAAPVTGPEVPIITWTDAITRYLSPLRLVTPDLAADVTVQEETVPTVIPTISYEPKLAIPAGTYVWLPLSNKGNVSLASGAGLWDINAQVTALGLPPGEALTLQVVCCDRPRDSSTEKTVVVGVLAQNDLNANKGRANGQVYAHRQVGPTDRKGATRVYRIRAFASHPVTITRLTVDASVTRV